jgi:hypothetical protein
LVFVPVCPLWTSHCVPEFEWFLRRWINRASL